MLLEVACFNLESCLIAQRSGAKRVELCENYSVGGITPHEELISKARKELEIDLFVMIRPREGNFIYSEIELEEMRSQIEFCKEEKCDGIAFGILTEKNKVDVEACKELVELAKPMECTFHRAFDEIKNSEEALENIIRCGFSRILTSGKGSAAQNGIEAIQRLIHKANKRIIIMPGGGIRSSNISELLHRTVATEFHSAAITGKSEMADASEIKKMISAF
jgi:copper homeostasis protein